MAVFTPVYGTVTSISPLQNPCSLRLSLLSREIGPVNVTVTPQTYVAGEETLKVGDYVVAFYDSEAPAPLIYPPVYLAVAMAEIGRGVFASFDYYDMNLFNSDHTLKLNLPQNRPGAMLMANGQIFQGNPGNHYLFVLYRSTTRSIPAQTTPEKIIVFC